MRLTMGFKANARIAPIVKGTKNVCAQCKKKTTPPAVKDETERTEIFDYRVPIDVGGAPNSIDGTLYWVGPADTSKAPFLIAGAAIVVLGGLLILVVRRRRGDGGSGSGEPREAW